jgi:hypothetical protein
LDTANTKKHGVHSAVYAVFRGVRRVPFLAGHTIMDIQMYL